MILKIPPEFSAVEESRPFGFELVLGLAL